MSVFDTAAVGKGFPDLVVGWRGLNFLVEIKDGDKPPSARKLTVDEQAFHDAWGGEVIVADNPEDAVVQVICAERRARG